MDPVCHTLVGAALAESGLKRTTALGTATLLIGANLPDVDALTYFAGDSLLWRRGWTHGVLALVVLPFVLTGLALAWDHLVRRRGGRRPDVPARAAPLLGLASVSIASHPLLDWLNNYGVRWLMPFDGTWFYGDTLFIVDPWMWAMLGLGVLASRAVGRRTGYAGASRPARVALVLTALYIVAMLGATRYGRTLVAQAIADEGLPASSRFMVSPVAAHPFVKHVVVDGNGIYYTGRARLLDGVVTLGRWPTTNASDHPAARAAAARPDARGIVDWARFPFYTVEDRGEAWQVRIDDLRYAEDGVASWAALDVTVPKALVSAR